jgi:hypothetical protein
LRNGVFPFPEAAHSRLRLFSATTIVSWIVSVLFSNHFIALSLHNALHFKNLKIFLTPTLFHLI